MRRRALADFKRVSSLGSQDSPAGITGCPPFVCRAGLPTLQPGLDKLLWDVTATVLVVSEKLGAQDDDIEGCRAN